MRYPEDSHEYLQDLSGHNQEVLRERMEEYLQPDDAQIEAEAELLLSCYRVQCVTVASMDGDDPCFEDHWIGAYSPREAHEELLQLYAGLEVVDVFTEAGERCVY